MIKLKNFKNKKINQLIKSLIFKLLYTIYNDKRQNLQNEKNIFVIHLKKYIINLNEII